MGTKEFELLAREIYKWGRGFHRSSNSVAQYQRIFKKSTGWGTSDSTETRPPTAVADPRYP